MRVFPLILKQARVKGGDIFGYVVDPVEMQLRAAAVIRGIEEGWLKMAPLTEFQLSYAASAHRVPRERCQPKENSR